MERRRKIGFGLRWPFSGGHWSLEPRAMYLEFLHHEVAEGIGPLQQGNDSGRCRQRSEEDQIGPDHPCWDGVSYE